MWRECSRWPVRFISCNDNENATLVNYLGNFGLRFRQVGEHNVLNTPTLRISRGHPKT